MSCPQAALSSTRRAALGLAAAVGIAAAAAHASPHEASSPRRSTPTTARLLDDPREALLARAHLIECAEREILIQSFIYGDDRLTFGVLALLRDAARRGVTVRVLTDAQWSFVPPAMETHLVAAGVEVREFHPFRLGRLRWVTRRMHDKTLVVDRRHLLLGGRNLQAPYFGHGEEVGRRDYLDTDAVLEGDVALAARAHFLSTWEGAHVRKIRNAVFPQDVARAGERLDEAERWLHGVLAEHRADPELAPAPELPVDAARFVHDVPDAKREPLGVARSLLALLEDAEESVVIETPYLVPTKGFRRALRAALDRGVEVSILTNSLATTDNLWPQAAYAGDRKWLVRRGVELFETKGPESHHAKSAVIDGELVVIGSFNLDPRSEKLNTEVVAILRSEELARRLLEVTRARQADAWEIGPDGRPVGEARRYPGVSRCKIWRMRWRRLIVPFLRGQI